jgi:1-acyl-sn-glycerol-3-phosphate acyltransferase
VRIEGLENLPETGSYIATANHVGRLEVLLTFYVVRRNDVILLIAEKYRNNRILSWLARRVDGIFVDRFNPDLHALRETLRRLQQGGVLAISPEGTRSPNGNLIQARQGAAYLAAKSQLPVVAVASIGNEDAVVKARFRRLRRADVLIRIGKPYYLPPLDPHQRAQQLEQFTDEIMCHIAALLPEERRGYYRNYPRVNELIQQDLA